MNSDPTEGVWHNRTVDLSAFAGKTVNNLWVTADAATPVGAWNIYYGEIAIYSVDGTVTTIYDRAPGESFSYFSGGGETGTNAIVSRSSTANDAKSPEVSTTYYAANQVGSTVEGLANGGWPVTQDTIYPYGIEPSPPASPNTHKFAGMKRDEESGRLHVEVNGDPLPGTIRLDNFNTSEYYWRSIGLGGINTGGNILGIGGTGTNGSSSTSSKDPCANATLAATGVDARQNIAQANRWTFMGAVVGSLFGQPFAGALAGYGAVVRTGGPQDVKNQPGPGTSRQRVDAGNISYGITCPFGAAFCQFAAGAAQTLDGGPNPNGTLKTGFDTPTDNAGIRQGQAMRAAGCHG